MSEPITDLLGRRHRDGLFSAAAWTVGERDRVLTRGMLGTRARQKFTELDGAELDDAELDGTERFDLASMTKPILTLALLRLVEQGRLALLDPVSAHLPEFADTALAPLLVRDLMLHTAGLPAIVELFRAGGDRKASLTALAAVQPIRPPGIAVEYSCQNYILLGLIAERITGAGLQDLVDDSVNDPLGTRLQYLPSGPTVATESDPWRGRTLQGEVHDENAASLGGVSGNAGLFGTLDEVSALARVLAQGPDADLLVRPATWRAMTRGWTDHLNEARGLGWQGRLPGEVRDLLGPRTFGHTGFTGTSITIDPDTGRWCVLLTNRVHPTRATEGIVSLRSAFHSVAATLD